MLSFSRLWNYRGGVEPLLATIEYGVCLIEAAEEHRTEGIAGKAIEGQRDGVLRRLAVLEFQGARPSHPTPFGPIPQFQSKSQ